MAGQVVLTTETTPFDDTAAKYTQMLGNLQGNILASHGRHFSVHIFFKFGADSAAAKTAILALRHQGFINSAADQAAQTARFKAGSTTQEVFGTLLLSARGLSTLGLNLPAGFGATRVAPPPGPNVSFFEPMSAAAAILGDTPSDWDANYQQPIDGLLIVAYGNSDANNSQAILDQCFALAKTARDILEAGGVTVLAVETGHAHLIDGEPREHFGFVDGVSQPLFRQSDLNPSAIGATDQFNPGDGLVNLLVPDPFTDAPDAFASFFVFRKLEQNVKAWRDSVVATAGQLNVSPALTGAMAVGRFQNGDPVVISAEPLSNVPASPLNNNFTYATDPDALKCPFHAHTRKSNPRGDTERSFAPGNDAVTAVEQARRIARRGVSYGNRARDLSDAPETGVGLLFMCYQANIPDQFAFIQALWVDNDNFSRAGVGQDAVIGQGTPRPNQTWPTAWGGPGTTALPDFGQFVTNKGGEFFLAVSIPTLEALV